MTDVPRDLPDVLDASEYAQTVAVNARTLADLGPTAVSWAAEARRAARVPYATALNLACAAAALIRTVPDDWRIHLRLAPECACALSSIWDMGAPEMTETLPRHGPDDRRYATWTPRGRISIQYGRVMSSRGRTWWEDWIHADMDIGHLRPRRGSRHVLPGEHAASPVAARTYDQLRAGGASQETAARTVADTFNLGDLIDTALTAWQIPRTRGPRLLGQPAHSRTRPAR